MTNDLDVPWSRSQPNARKKSIAFDWRHCQSFPEKKLKSIKAQEKIVEARRRRKTLQLSIKNMFLLKLCCYTWESMVCKEIFLPPVGVIIFGSKE